MTITPVHIHLALNHIPVIFPVAALILWAAAKILKNDGYRKAALLIAIVGGLLVVPAYLSGEEAEEILEHKAGYSESIIHDHEEMAEKALITGLALAAIALAALWRERKPNPPAWIYWAPLFMLFFTAGAMGYTAFTGGHIKHDEIRETQTTP